ncbi:hypothetical protein [Rubrivirga sp. SAORIC476]|nr:hypothetical protein [Rubrivirga sp. SAORIC476]
MSTTNNETPDTFDPNELDDSQLEDVAGGADGDWTWTPDDPWTPDGDPVA